MNLYYIIFIIAVVIILLPFSALAAIPIIRNGSIWHPMCHSKRKLKGKTTLVTGASAEEIISSTGNKNVVIYELDTSSLKSVRKFAADVLKRESRLDILVNNAGIGGHPKRVLTEDGFELTMATNHYGHFLLTNLLLDLIKKSSPARIINVTSAVQKNVHSLDTQDLMFKNVKKYGQFIAYAQSKLCNVLFTYELARILSGTGVQVNCVHPGLVASEIFGKSNPIFKPFDYIVRLTAMTEKEGAQTTIYAALSEETENMTGKYFARCKVANSSKLSQDVDLARKLWDESVECVKLLPQEVHY